jgi:hypothetical protein
VRVRRLPAQSEAPVSWFWGIAVPAAIMIVSFALTLYLYKVFSEKER